MFRVQAKPELDSPWPGVEPGALRTLKPIRRLPGRNRTKADILVYRSGGVEIAVKDYAPRFFLVRHLLGRYLIRREAAAHRAAAGVPGLPRFLGRIGPFALATEWVQARPMSTFNNGDLDSECFARAREILREFHGRGIALANLHHRNLLVSENGAVYVVDLATAWMLGRRPSGWRRLVFERFCEHDKLALARLRARFTGGDPDGVVDQVGGATAAWYRRARRLRSLFDRLRRRQRGC